MVAPRVPARRRARGRVRAGEAGASLAADRAEGAADVYGRAGERQGIDGNLGAAAWVRIPARGCAGAGVEGGEAIAVLPADRGEEAARVDGRAGDGEGPDPGDGEADLLPAGRKVCVRIPGRGRARVRLKGGDRVAGLAADRAEGAADVYDRPGDAEGEDLAVGTRVPTRRRPGGGVERCEEI